MIRSVTAVTSVPLVPEVKLHLLSPEHPLWTASEDEAARHGLEAPYWAFAWPGGQALARWVLDHPALVRGRRVLDVGSGGAIEGLAAVHAGAAAVLCADVDPVACCCAGLNAALNGWAVEVLVADVLTLAPASLACDVVLVGDLSFDEAITARLVPWLRAHRALGRTVLVGDAGRVPLAADFVELGAHPAPFDGNPAGSASWRISIRGLAP
ncbi:MAG: methyltransferase [Myxococcaceae bacterium]|nr:methyltransferase [Myxococcaceae bacterium]